MIKKIIKVIRDFLQLSVRSEQDVRSKLIVPLSEALGYKPCYRGEDFPVYSFHGRKKLPTVSADYLFFDEKTFNDHDKCTQNDRDWVQDHCLLVIEAKKPGEMPDVQGQAQFYSIGTRSLAYLVTDGVSIKGWIRNNLCSDKEISNINIDIDADYNSLLEFSFSNLLSLKEVAVSEKNIVIITDPADLDLSTETINSIRDEMGRNAEGLDDLQLVTQYFNLCDFILNSDLRYGIPEFALDLPREIVNAKVYCDEVLVPIDNGEVVHSYCNDVDRYQYNSEILSLDIFTDKDGITLVPIEMKAISRSVKVRINRIKSILVFLRSKTITIAPENMEPLRFSIYDCPNEESKNKLSEYEQCFTYWLDGLELLCSIEDYYGIHFNLSQVEDVERLYNDAALICDGFGLCNNAFLNIPAKEMTEDIEIDTPTVLKENEEISLSDIVIMRKTFHPYKTTLLPGKYKIKELIDGDIVKLPICCEYKLIESKRK